ncbi:MAG: PAS domain-containing protein [Mycobacterium sp.]
MTDAAAQRMSRSHAGLLAGVFDEVDVGLVSVNPDSDFAHVNRTAAALVNMPVGDATVAAFNGAIANLAQRALNQGEVAEWLGSLERDPTAEFKSLWVFADYPTHLGVVSKPAPYPGFDGRIWAFYDNSPLARAVKASDHANARLRASADTMLDPQVLLEAVVEDGRIADLVTRDANNATCDYLGLHKAELIGRSVRQTMPIMARSGMLAQFIHCADGGDPVILDGVAFDSGIPGGLRYYDIRASRAEPGWISVTWRDVTERSELAQRIAESEEHFRLLAEDVGDVVVRLDEDGMMTWISKSIEHVLGATADHWLGQKVFDFAPLERREEGFENWSRIAEAGTYVGRARVYSVDGTPHTIHLHSKPFYEADGRRNGIVGSFRIIDAEVALEEAAQQQIALRDAQNRSLAGRLRKQTERLMADLDSAARYVSSILPGELTGPVWVTAEYMPSRHLSGDSYDYRWIDDEHLIAYLGRRLPWRRAPPRRLNSRPTRSRWASSRKPSTTTGHTPFRPQRRFWCSATGRSNSPSPTANAGRWPSSSTFLRGPLRGPGGPRMN